MAKGGHGEHGGGGGGAHHAPVHREAAHHVPHLPGHSGGGHGGESIGPFKWLARMFKEAKEKAPNIPLTLLSLGTSAWLMGAPFNQAMVNAWSTGVEAKGFLHDLGIEGKKGGGGATAHH